MRYLIPPYPLLACSRGEITTHLEILYLIFSVEWTDFSFQPLIFSVPFSSRLRILLVCHIFIKVLTCGNQLTSFQEVRQIKVLNLSLEGNSSIPPINFITLFCTLSNFFGMLISTHGYYMQYSSNHFTSAAEWLKKTHAYTIL